MGDLAGAHTMRAVAQECPGHGRELADRPAFDEQRQRAVDQHLFQAMQESLRLPLLVEVDAGERLGRGQELLSIAERGNRMCPVEQTVNMR